MQGAKLHLSKRHSSFIKKANSPIYDRGDPFAIYTYLLI